MTKADLMKLVGKNIFVYFKGEESGVYGTLGYVDEFSAKYDYRKPNYFYINHISFKASHVRKLAESEEISKRNMKMWAEIFKAESEVES